MAEFERVASVDELSPGQRLSVFVDDEPVLLLQLEDGCYRAIEDVCTHDGQPLTDGPIIDGAIRCERHGARFDLRTGRALCMPATESVRVYDVKVEDGSIYLRESTGEATCSHPGPANTALEVPDLPPGAMPIPAGGGGSADAGSETEADEDTHESAASLDQKMVEALKSVIDPELMVNVVDLGLIYSINHDGHRAFVDMTLTSPACPAGPQLVQQAKMALERLREIEEAEIRLVMTPPWSPERMTDEARDHLGIF